MRPKRPWSVVILSVLIAAAGVVGVIYHLGDFQGHARQADVWLLLALRVVAIVCGVFLFRGRNWARWLTLSWIAFHVVVSAFDSWAKFGMHAALLALFGFFLFRPASNAYFAAKSDLAEK